MNGYYLHLYPHTGLCSSFHIVFTQMRHAVDAGPMFDLAKIEYEV